MGIRVIAQVLLDLDPQFSILKYLPGVWDKQRAFAPTYLSSLLPFFHLLYIVWVSQPCGPTFLVVLPRVLPTTLAQVIIGSFFYRRGGKKGNLSCLQGVGSVRKFFHTVKINYSTGIIQESLYPSHILI